MSLLSPSILGGKSCHVLTLFLLYYISINLGDYLNVLIDLEIPVHIFQHQH